MVRILYQGFAHCDGSILSPSLILTAAHCVEGVTTTPQEFTVIVGDHATAHIEPSEQHLRVKEIKVHGAAQVGALGITTYDAAVLILKSPLQFSAEVQPIQLGTFGEYETHQKMYKDAENLAYDRAYNAVLAYYGATGEADIPASFEEVWLLFLQHYHHQITFLRPFTFQEHTSAGWGTWKDRFGVVQTAPSPTLFDATLPVVPQQVCTQSYGHHIQASMYCAGFADGGIDTCQGDSGGPAFYLGPNGWVQIGVVSWGFGCAQPDYYGVYTRVDAIRTWLDNMKAYAASGN